jgi:hypothetical protein
VVGSDGDAVPGVRSGRAYAFLRQGDAWQEQTRLQNSDFLWGDQFGNAVAADASRGVVGAPSRDGPGPDVGTAYVFDLTPEPPVGTSFCAGDGGGAPCPCGNESAPGSGRGCATSTGEGALLLALGSASVSEAALGVYARDLPTRSSCFLVGSLSDLGGGVPFGDGLQCLGGALTRLGGRAGGATGVVSWDPDVAQVGPWGAGQTIRLQAWFRDNGASPCGAHFNTTQALAILLTP